jgi:hypothetical protein
MRFSRLHYKGPAARWRKYHNIKDYEETGPLNFLDNDAG